MPDSEEGGRSRVQIEDLPPPPEQELTPEEADEVNGGRLIGDSGFTAGGGDEPQTLPNDPRLLPGDA